MKKPFLFVAAAWLILRTTTASAIDVPDHALTLDATVFPNGYRISNFMDKLARNESVLIAYSGQSGINPGNTWMGMVVQALKRRFPGATIRESNQAVGGCAAECMYPQMDGRFAGLNPDLTFVYIAGAEEPFEGMLRKLRMHVPMSSEIVLMNYHVWISADQGEATFSNYHSYFLTP